MQLLKIRKFSDIFNDTIGFFKTNGKHFFGNYILLNAIPFMIMAIMIYFFSSSFYGLTTQQMLSDPNMIANYLTDNIIVILFLVIFFIIVMIIFSIMNYAFPATYLILYQENGGPNFAVKDIFDMMFKEKIGKIMIFILVSFLISIPVMMVAVIAGLILMFTGVGIFFLVAILGLWYNMAFIEYISSNKGVFESFGYAWDLLWIKFWSNIGALTLITGIVMVINTGVSLITNVITTVFSTNMYDGSGEQAGIVLITVLIGSLVSNGIGVFLQTINQVAHYMVYYGLKESVENISGGDEIDKIGLGEN